MASRMAAISPHFAMDSPGPSSYQTMALILQPSGVLTNKVDIPCVSNEAPFRVPNFA